MKNPAIIDREKAVRWSIIGLVMTIVTLLAPVVVAGRVTTETAALAGTLVLTTLSMAHIFTALGSRSEHNSVFSQSMLVKEEVRTAGPEHTICGKFLCSTSI
jgi:magnesium-transporting ATPase (P-type)